MAKITKIYQEWASYEVWNVDDTAYASSWNGATTVAPSKNAVYDKINSLETDIANAGKYYVITEDMVTVTTDSTKWVSPYNTSYGYTNITINADSGVSWEEWATYRFIINTELVVASATRNVRVRIWTNDSRHPVMAQSNTILAWSSYFTKARNDSFVYKTTYQSVGALHLSSGTDTSYSAMSVAEGTAWTATSSRVVRADYLKQIIQAVAPVTSVNGSTGDVTITDTTYSAGTGLSLNWTKFSVDTDTIATKSYVANEVANFAGFKVVSALPTSNISANIIYLLWPIGSWADKYEEWIYSNNAWVKIWETSVDLTNYFNMSSNTSDNITAWSTNLFLTSAERTKLSNTSWTNSWDETTTTIKNKLWAASSAADGYLTKWDWSTFNSKVDSEDLHTVAISWLSSDLTNDAGFITSSAIPTDYVSTSWNQTIAGTKTFSTSPVVPTKSTAAANSWTVIATEAQVYAVSSALSNYQPLLTAWSNVQISWNTISATDTTYSCLAAASWGTACSLVTTGEKYTWNNKQNALSNLTAACIKAGTATTQGTVTASILASALPTLSTQANSCSKVQVWVWTQACYDALGTYNACTLYFTTD